MPRLALLAVLASLVSSLSAPSLRAVDLTAPAYNWALPLFTKEGFRTMVAHGSKASVTGKDQYEVADLNLTLFSGDAAARVETVILSPAATFEPDAKLAHGENHVRFIRDEVEAAGTRWTYDHAHKKISLDGDVRVTFNAEVTALLK